MNHSSSSSRSNVKLVTMLVAMLNSIHNNNNSILQGGCRNKRRSRTSGFRDYFLVLIFSGTRVNVSENFHYRFVEKYIFASGII